MMRLMAAAFGTIFLLTAPPFAQAEDTPEWKTCISVTNSGAERLAASTAVIDSRAETGRRLAGPYCIRGHELTEKSELDAALPDLNEAIKADGTYACAFNNRGRAYGFKGDHDRAIADYDAAIGIDPKFAIAYNNRGDAWHHKGDLARALTDFDEAIRLNPHALKAYGNRGLVHFQKRDYARAIEDYTVQIRIAPDVLAHL